MQEEEEEEEEEEEGRRGRGREPPISQLTQAYGTI